jgi:16S rRNA (adenine1518-N6/adenine1519-N6)-dimethyltransferase
MPLNRTLLPQLRDLGLAPRKGLGQHYLTDPTILAGIVTAAELPPDAVVIEVGPGPGTLTAELAQEAGRLIAVELDTRLASMLEQLYADTSHVHILQGDALTLTPNKILSSTGGVAPYFVVGNLPYYITSALLRHFLEADPAPERMVVTIQLDVAKRIIAKPPQMSILAIAIQAYAKPKIVRQLPPGAFSPPPKVHSAVLRLDRLSNPVVSPAQRQHFFAVVRAGFGQKRKTLRNSLSSGLKLSTQQIEDTLFAAGISPQQRAQELDLRQWMAISETLATG